MTPRRVFGMVFCGQHTMRTNENAVLDSDAAEGEEGASKVHEAVPAEGGAFAVVDVERCEHAYRVGNIVAGYPAQVFAHLFFGVPAAVHLRRKLHCALHVDVVNLSGVSYFFLCLYHFHFLYSPANRFPSSYAFFKSMGKCSSRCLRLSSSLNMLMA